MPLSPSPLVTVSQAAHILAVTPSTVWKKVALGTLPARVSPEGIYLIELSAVRAYKQRRTAARRRR